jgi:hypothetical protein
MYYSINQINALIRLFLFNTRIAYSVKEMREKVKNETICFTLCEINDEVIANQG